MPIISALYEAIIFDYDNLFDLILCVSVRGCVCVYWRLCVCMRVWVCIYVC